MPGFASGYPSRNRGPAQRTEAVLPRLPERAETPLHCTAQLGDQGRLVKSLTQCLAIHEAVLDGGFDKVAVLLPTRNQLRDHQVMRIQAPPRCASRSRPLYRDEAITPARRQGGCLLSDA